MTDLKQMLRQNSLRAVRFRLHLFSYAARDLWRAIRGRPRIVFYPHFPTTSSAVERSARHLGFALSNNPRRKADIAFKWVRGGAWQIDVPELSAHRQVVNGELRDITKKRCMLEFERAFGIPFEVDPTTHEGPAIRKSDGNAKHDAVVVQCPISRDEIVSGQVYQRHVDTTLDDGLMEELRVVIVAHEAVLVYIKYRRPEAWFGALENEIVHMASPAHVFDQSELGQLADFCEGLQLEVGELDVLRDTRSQELFVIDANPVPFGPPNHLSPAEFEASAALVGHALADAYAAPGMATRRVWPPVHDL